MKLKVSVSIGLAGCYREIEVEIDPNDYRKEDGGLDHAALDEAANEILFNKLISWDWSIEGADEQA